MRIIRDGGKVKACLEEQLVRGQVTVPDIKGEGRAGEVRNCQVGR